MKIGTKSVLFGAHCFFLHPWFVAAAWTKLYGFPLDLRLWVAFAVHDIGYLGKPNMDGPEGEEHPWAGAKICSWLFDTKDDVAFPSICGRTVGRFLSNHFGSTKSVTGTNWFSFCLYHSRYLSKKYGVSPSRLCFPDKLSFALTPWWIYLPMVTATGEIREYLRNAQKADSGHWKPTGWDKRKWHAQLCDYMRAWVAEHINGADDTWTDARRNAATESWVRK